MDEDGPGELQGVPRERPPYVAMVVGPGLAADNRRIRRGLFALGFDEEAVNGLCPYERF